MNDKKNMFLKNHIAWLLGIIAVIIFLIPYIIQGADSTYIMHDQFDGEVLAFICQARDIGLSNFPEFMNGAAKTSLTMPSPGFLILYLLFNSSTAFLIQYITVALIAFLGMYLLAKEVTGNQYIASVAAVAFACLPSYTVYGFGVMGQPLLFYALIQLWQGRKRYISYFIIALFSIFSSLIVIGFADCGILLVCLICTYIKKKESKIKKYFWIAMIEMCGLYIVMTGKLLYQIFFATEAVHKEELVAQASPFISSFTDILVNGYYHAASIHKIILFTSLFVLIVVFILLIMNRKWKMLSEERVLRIRSDFRLTFVLLSVCVFIAAFYGFWHSSFFVSLRNNMGILNAAQLDRIYWLYPTLWYLIFALMLKMIVCLVKPVFVKGLILVSLSISVLLSVADSNYAWKATTLHAVGVETPYITLGNVTESQFFAENLFEEIKDYIGLSPNEYKVISLGLFPSIPLYNGFYCIDGYSNNYTLSYKHSFRELIAGELDKNSTLRAYFDLWGNRCYLFCDEIPQRYFITKVDNITVNELSLNTKAMQELGCDYLLSTVVIGNSEEIHLELLHEFEREDSIYHIYLYHAVSE